MKLGETHCDLSLKTKYVLGLKEYMDDTLKLRGWFLSPYKDVSIYIETSSADLFQIIKFDDRPEVAHKFPEYNQNGRGFYFEKKISNKAHSFSFILRNKEQELVRKTFKLNQLTKKLISSGKKNISNLLRYEEQFLVPNGNEVIPFIKIENIESIKPDKFFCQGWCCSKKELQALNSIVNNAKKIDHSNLGMIKNKFCVLNEEKFPIYSFELTIQAIALKKSKIVLQFKNQKKILFDYILNDPLSSEKLTFCFLKKTGESSGDFDLRFSRFLKQGLIL